MFVITGRTSATSKSRCCESRTWVAPQVHFRQSAERFPILKSLGAWNGRQLKRPLERNFGSRSLEAQATINRWSYRRGSDSRQPQSFRIPFWPTIPPDPPAALLTESCLLLRTIPDDGGFKYNATNGGRHGDHRPSTTQFWLASSRNGFKSGADPLRASQFPVVLDTLQRVCPAFETTSKLNLSSE